MIVHNEIEIKYEDGVKFGRDNINIDIKNASSGALLSFLHDLDQLAAKWVKANNECWHPVTQAYADMLLKLVAELKNKLPQT